MQRIFLFLAYFFIWTTLAAQQYPFVHYTPKDGLISNRVRSIYQDSKGRLYFTTLKGLSVYDGARFTNYNTEDGLQNDIVNCVMEMGDDSIWVITNSGMINCLVKGKLKNLSLQDSLTPVINYLCRNEKGDLYAAADEGLFLFQQNRFIKLPFTDVAGKNLGTYISYFIPIGDYLLVMRDYGLITADEQYVLFLYSLKDKKIIAQTSNTSIYSIGKAPDGRIWVSTEKKIMEINTSELDQGKIVLKDLPDRYKKISGYGTQLIFFDNGGNCWLTDRNKILTKCDPAGIATAFSTSSGLSSADVNYVLQDKEGSTWLATNGGGVDKMMHAVFSVIEKFFDLPAPSSLVLSKDKNELILYSLQEEQAIWFTNTYNTKRFRVINANKFGQVVRSGESLYGIGTKIIYRLQQRENTLNAQPVFEDTSTNLFNSVIIDQAGNLVICGKENMTVLIDGKKIFQKKLPYQTDQAVLDKKGNIWIATRADQLIMCSTHPDDPSGYLKTEILFTKELQGLSPRSVTIDNSGLIWIGTRYKGLFGFGLGNGKLTQKYHLTSRDGLSENFITYLSADENNNIWACTPSGLDRISIKKESPAIENITRQNNIYQSINKVVIDKNKTVWALSSAGLIRIAKETEISGSYIPRLMMTQIRSGADTLNTFSASSLSYQQNNLNFYFAAPTFLDEKQVLYSYQLQGSGNNQWSDPSNNASVSCIDLPPGNYVLNIKASFPAGRYADQVIQYKFSISPPWWQTWWFRIVIGLLVIVLLISGIQFYYRRKLEKQKTILENQRAIEKERTRIATDMHDDLGAGLSRIKFLSETIGIKKQKQQPIEEEISKIREYAHEMIDKMGEIVWALNEKNDTLSDLLSYSRSYAVEYLSQNGIECKVQAPDNFPAVFVSGEFRRNIYLVLKEALHNIIKHAQASHVRIMIEIDHQLTITVQDDGAGFDINNTRPFSNGLSNMEKRLKDIGGAIRIENERGTTIHLTAPLPS